MLPDLEQHGINPTQLSQAFIGSLNDSGVLPTNDVHKYNYEKTSNGYSKYNSVSALVLFIGNMQFFFSFLMQKALFYYLRCDKKKETGLRPDFTSKLVHLLALEHPNFYIAPYDKIKHELVNLSSNCDVKSGLSLLITQFNGYMQAKYPLVYPNIS